MAETKVKVQIRNPNGSKEAVLCVETSALVGTLKQQLQREYPGNPRPEDQKLIYCGQVLADKLEIKSVFRNANIEEMQTLHIVMKPDPKAPLSPVASPQKAVTPSSTPAINSSPKAEVPPTPPAVGQSSENRAHAPASTVATPGNSKPAGDSTVPASPSFAQYTPNTPAGANQHLPPFHASPTPFSPGMGLPFASPFMVPPPTPVIHPPAQHGNASPQPGTHAQAPTPHPVYLMNPFVNAMTLNSALITLQQAHMQSAAMFSNGSTPTVDASKATTPAGTSASPGSQNDTPIMHATNQQQGATAAAGAGSSEFQHTFPMFPPGTPPPFAPILPYPMPMGPSLPYPYPMPLVPPAQHLSPYNSMYMQAPMVAPQPAAAPVGPDARRPATNPSPASILRRRREEVPEPVVQANRDEGAQQNNVPVADQDPAGRPVRVIRIDLRLAIKLIVMVGILNQDGSTVKIVLMSLGAIFVYLFQTGALAALQRRLNPPHMHPQGEEEVPLRQQNTEAAVAAGANEGAATGEHVQQRMGPTAPIRAPPTGFSLCVGDPNASSRICDFATAWLA